MPNTQIDYFGENNLLTLCTLIKNELTKYVLAVQGKGLSTNDFTDALKTKLEGIDLSLYATLNSPTFTGVPSAPTAAENSSSTQIATTAFVMTALNSALSQITGIEFDGPYESYQDMVESVTTPRTGTIYLVNNSGTSPNVKDEYFWTGSAFELFGTTEIDLSDYVQFTDVIELTAQEVTTIWNSVFTAQSNG